MRPHDLATEVRDLVAGLDSTDQLEVLLLLLGSPSRVFDCEEIAEALGLTPEASTSAADALCDRRLIAAVPTHPRQPAFQYAPTTIALHAAAEELAAAWRTQSVTIIKLLCDRPGRALHAFADAFRFRRPSRP